MPASLTPACTIERPRVRVLARPYVREVYECSSVVQHFTHFGG